MPALQYEKHTLTTRTHGTPLVCTIKRYTRGGSSGKGTREPGAILLLGHGAGFPKETWEPVISDLFALDDAKPTGGLRVREAWALDCQNHGEAAVLNGEVLAKDPSLLDIYDYADAFASLYRSGLLGTLDPKLDKVILVGHSAGSVGVTLATSFFNPPSTIPFHSMILVDPPMQTTAMRGRESEMYKLVEAMTPLRKDVWPSRENAAAWMRNRLPWSSWDPRVLDVYTEYGLQDLPTPYYPDKKGVTLTTHRSGENIAFTGEIFSFHALYRLNQICADLPVHLVYGGENDMFEREVQDTIIDPQEGRKFESVRRLEGVGHLVVQEAPLKLAKAILDILRQTSSSKPTQEREIKHKL